MAYIEDLLADKQKKYINQNVQQAVFIYIIVSKLNISYQTQIYVILPLSLHI